MSAVITGIGIANPRFNLTQSQIFSTLGRKKTMSPVEKTLYRRFLGDRGVHSRHFAVRSFDDFFEKDQDELIRRFEREAARLSERSVEACLRRTGARRQDIGFVAVSTCTGYLCPGLTSHVIERNRLSGSVQTADLVGMGCGGAMPVLQACANYLNAHPNSTALAVSTEICSSAIFWGDDPELILSNSIFGDGSAACLLTNRKGASGFGIEDFQSRTMPKDRELLRFRTQDSRLRNVIKPAVPDAAAAVMKELVAALERRQKVTRKDIRFWALHPGGRKVLDRIQGALGLAPDTLTYSREVLRRYGNMSSPSVLFVLERILKSARFRKGDRAVMASFGAGFSAYGALLRRV